MCCALGVAGLTVWMAAQSGFAYVHELVRAEQDDHDRILRARVMELARAMANCEKVIAEIDEKQTLSSSDRKKILMSFRDLEECGLGMSRRMIFYAEDTTAHMFFAPTQRTTDFFTQARNTQLYVNRCVRSVETICATDRPTQAQKDVMHLQCDALREEITRLQQY